MFCLCSALSIYVKTHAGVSRPIQCNYIAEKNPTHTFFNLYIYAIHPRAFVFAIYPKTYLGIICIRRIIAIDKIIIQGYV